MSMSMEAQKHTEDVKSQSGLELEEDDSSDSSCMIVSESPSVLKKGFPYLNERTISRDPRKETCNQIADDSSQTSKRYNTTGGRLDSQAHTSALKRAKELQTSLSTKHPSFIKQMHPSHVTQKFVLGVPLEFRKLHLPAHHVEVTLENECGKSHNVSFLGGTEGRFIWKRFWVANNLLEGDVVVFHLLRPCYFKVYIVRANDPSVVGSTDLTSSNVHANKGKQKCEATDRKGCRLAPHLDTVQESVKRTSLLSSPCVEPQSGHSSSEEFQSSDMEATPLSGRDADFGNITNIVHDSSQTSKRYKATGGRLDSQALTSALKRAKELQTSLSTKHPSFIKQMQRSHVTEKFELSVPSEFRRLHLPAHHVQVTLENERSKSFKVNFLGHTKGIFMSGWKMFSAAHNLFEGDVVVFHLLGPCYFKVYILRADDATVVGSTDLTSSNFHAKEGKQKRESEAVDRKGCRVAPHLDTVQESVRRTSLLSNPRLEPGLDHSISEESQSTDMEASPLSGCDADFKNITNVTDDNYQTSERFMTKRGRKDSEARTSALERAKELQTNLSSEHPSFIKKIYLTNVVKSKAMLNVPAEFCTAHLPKHDVEVTLEDESGESYKVKFLTHTTKRFIGGWTRFSTEHKLLEGDAIVFHLIATCYFKVYIIRANDPTSTNFTSSNINANEVKKKRKHEAADPEDPKLAQHLDTAQESVKRTSLLSNPRLEPGSDHSVSIEEVHSSDTKACPSPGCDAGFDNFRIVVNDEIIDGELSRSTRFKFYKLCCSRESYLHEHLLESVDRKLAAGIITGTLKVADAIRACKLSSASEEDFAMWDNTLAGFERLGMDVEFMRDRLKLLASRASELREKEEVKRYKEAIRKRGSNKEEMKRMEQKYLELKQTTEKLVDEMKTIKANILKCRDDFQEEANAPW